jgi:DNA processing protein
LAWAYFDQKCAGFQLLFWGQIKNAILANRKPDGISSRVVNAVWRNVRIANEARCCMAGFQFYPTPHPTPLVDEDPVHALCLIRSRKVGPASYHRLIAEHGSVEAALAALPGIATAAGIAGYEPCPIGVARHEMAQGHRAGARLLVHGQAGYPAALMEVADAPPVLWAMGDVGLLSRPMVAMVGARNASSLGLRMARRLAETLGQGGQVVVSGLARGIDAAAHAAALGTGTIAVMAGGVDVIYPVENTELAGLIAAQGCLVSEQPMGLVPQARHFPQRNRIVAGLARAVVVVEAAARSGSLITARDAADLGRDVLAVPGHPFDARAAGCNMLIREGATLIRHAADVLEAVGVAAVPVVHAAPVVAPVMAPVAAVITPPQHRTLADMTAVHSQILARLGPSPLAEDQLIRDLAMPTANVAPALIALELEGRILRQAGGLLCRVDEG